MEKLIEDLYKLEQLYLPNGATGAVWLEDVINVVKKYSKNDIK